MPSTAEAIRKPRSDDAALWDIIFGAYGKPAVMLAHKLKLFRPLHRYAKWRASSPNGRYRRDA